MREDWIECKVESISEYLRGITYKKENASDKELNGMFPILRANNIKDDKINFDELIFVNKNLINSNQILRKNDILFAMSSGSIHLVGKSAFINDDLQFSFGAFCGVLRPNTYINAKYLSFYFSSLGFKNYIASVAKGSNINNLKKEHLLNIQLPLPPLPEQRTIVKKLESLFSSLNAGVADLKKAQQQLKIYRQAVLKKAFEGEFTEEWRSKQNDLPSNDEILALAKNERSKYYHLQLNEWEEAVKDWKRSGSVDKKPIKPSKPKEFDVVKSDELETYDLGEAVKNWSRIGNLTYKVGDIDHKMPSTVADGIPYLSTGNIGKNGGLDFENAKRISEADYKRLALKIKPEKGDIIFPRYGTIGRNILIDIDKKFLVSYSCAIIKTLKEVYSPKFLLYYTLSPIIQKEIKRYTVETTQKNIGIASIERFICPIYSLLEQQQIIKEVESRLSVCDSIEQNIKESLVKAEALRQSILKKAFEGSLLTAQELAECKQAADYEPASVLLELIKAEQNKAMPKLSKKKVAQPLVMAKAETVVVKVSADIHAGLIAKVIKIHEDNPASIDNLSHIKCEKIAHLVEYHLQIPLGRQPVKDAAGPDDFPHLKKVEHRAEKAGFFNKINKSIGHSYSSTRNSNKVIEKFESSLSVEKNKLLNDLLALFLKFDLEVSEIIATTYAGWNNLILNGNTNPSDEEIVFESRENWSERKLKIARERFFKAIEWMRKNKIVPTGYGVVVPFPKKKK